MTFTRHAELSKSSTIPAEWYTSDEILTKEYRSIFTRTWQLVGNTSGLKNTGDFFTSKLGRENIVVLLDGTKTLRAFFNVCRHRAGPVATGAGNCTLLKCKYHAWTYDLSGALKTTPEFSGVDDFNPSDYSLVPIPIRAWGPLLFASPDPAMTFEEFLGNIPAATATLNLDQMKPVKQKDYAVDCNWKIYVDNYVEGYHIPSVHPSLNKELDYKEYRTDTFRWHSLQHAPTKHDAEIYRDTKNPHAFYYWVFPNLMLNIVQGVLQTNVVIPVGADRCIVRFEWFTTSEIDFKRVEELAKFSDLVQAEDAEICSRVHDNLRSISYQRGRYSVKRENGVHHFHSLVAEMLKV